MDLSDEKAEAVVIVTLYALPVWCREKPRTPRHFVQYGWGFPEITGRAFLRNYNRLFLSQVYNAGVEPQRGTEA